MISVVIVNFNGKHLLAECLDSLREQTLEDFEIIFVDNASSDGSVDYVQTHYPHVRVLENDRNLGFGEANNKGIRIARGRYIALLNNDTLADRRWLEALAESAGRSDGSFGMWASKILFYDERSVIDTAGHLIYPDGQNIGRGRGDPDGEPFNTEEEVFFPSGCAALYSRKMLDDIGLFDEDFFAYADDTELGLRARLANWKCCYVPSSVIYHKYSRTTGRYSPLKAYLVERNRIWVVVKYFPIRYIITSPFYTGIRLWYHLWSAFEGRGAAGRFTESFSLWKLIRVFLKADFDAVLGIPKMVKKRLEMRSIRRVSTRKFSSWLSRYGISARDLTIKE